MPPMAPCQSTSRPQWQFSSQRRASDELQLVFLVEQTSFRNHDDVAGAQPDVTFEVKTGFVSLIIEHENRLVAARGASSHLNALLGCERAHATRKRDRLHQGVGRRATYAPGPINFSEHKIL